MSVRPVLRYPHPLLKCVLPEVGTDSRLVVQGMIDLVDTMRSHRGCVGVAAPQIGVKARLIVVDVTDHPKATACHGLLQLINPRISAALGSEVGREGCLSIPGLTANVRRATEVVIEARSLDGEQLTVETDGFEARCLQHEIDHLDGILFLDRVDSLATDVFRRKKFK